MHGKLTPERTAGWPSQQGDQGVVQSGAQIQAAPQTLPAMAHATLGPEEALVWVIVNIGCSACHIVHSCAGQR